MTNRKPNLSKLNPMYRCGSEENFTLHKVFVDIAYKGDDWERDKETVTNAIAHIPNFFVLGMSSMDLVTYMKPYSSNGKHLQAYYEEE